MPIALKCCGLISKPFQWSGGKSKELSKHIGKHHLVDSFRAMLLSGILGKTVQGSLRAKTIDFASDYLGEYQFAGREKRGCDLASHVARTMLDYGKTLKATIVLLFVDLKNAVCSLLRSVVLRYGETDDVFAYIVKELKMPHDILTDLLDILREPPACRLAKMPEHLQGILQQHYQNTWLSVEHSSAPAKTCTGSQPGIPCADVLFMIAFTKANNCIRQELIQIGVLTKISWSGERKLRSSNINERPASLYVGDTSFADDLVLATVIRDNDTAIELTKIIFSIMHRHYLTFAFLPNLKERKECCALCCPREGSRCLGASVAQSKRVQVANQLGKWSSHLARCPQLQPSWYPFCRTPDLSAKSSIIAPPQPTPRSRRSERRSFPSQASEYAPSPMSAKLLLLVSYTAMFALPQLLTSPSRRLTATCTSTLPKHLSVGSPMSISSTTMMP